MNNILDLHTHSVLSKHAYSSTTENIDEAIKKGLKYLGLSEHQPDDVGVGAHIYGVNNGITIPRHIENLTILYGVECNLLNGGFIDDNKFKWDHFDYAICSIHGYVYKDEGFDGNTNNLLKILDNKHVKILGHLDRGHYAMDYDAVISKAKDKNVLIEINNASLNKNKYNIESASKTIGKILETCLKYNEPVIINSDAHVKYEVGNYKESLELIDLCHFPHEMVLNFNEELFKSYFPMI